MKQFSCVTLALAWVMQYADGPCTIVVKGVRYQAYTINGEWEMHPRNVPIKDLPHYPVVKHVRPLYAARASV